MSPTNVPIRSAPNVLLREGTGGGAAAAAVPFAVDAIPEGLRCAGSEDLNVGMSGNSYARYISSGVF